MRKWEQTEWDSVLGRMLALLFSSPCFPCLSSTATAVQRERQREKGNFSIAEAVRQETGERENKSAPVWSLVTTRGKGIVQEDRGGVGGGGECQRRLGLQRNNVLLLYVPLHSGPCVPSYCSCTHLMLHNPTLSMNPVMCAHTHTHLHLL